MNMSVRKLRNSWWVDFRFDDIRYRKRSPENSQSGARAYELLLRQRLTHGESINGKKQKEKPLPTFKEFSDQWFGTYVLTNNKISEQITKRSALKNHLVPFFGNHKLVEISNLQIEEYKAEKLRQGLSPEWINHHLRILGKCLRTAQEWIGLESIPKMKQLKVPPQKFDFLSPDESEQLLDSIQNKKWYTMVLIALRTGLRCGEILGLRWEDVDLDKELLTVRRSVVRNIIGTPKNNRERYIPLTREVCDALRNIKESDGFIFRRPGGKPMSYSTLKYRLHSFCRDIGLRKIGWHALRHTFASHLVAGAVPMRAVQELLGHSDLKTTLRYTHLAPSALRQAVEILGRNYQQNLGQLVVNSPHSS